MSSTDSDSELDNADSGNEHVDDSALQAEISDSERLGIREELSTMSFQELIELKEKIGSKLYNKALFGDNKTLKAKTNKVFKRANKNRPREVSSKIKVNPKNKSTCTKSSVHRDPRYDPAHFFDKKTFKNNFKFLNEVYEKELKALQKELNETTDEIRVKKIKKAIQSVKNKLHEESKNDELEMQKMEEKKQIKEKLKRGEKPVFKKKSDQRVHQLLNQYETLKNNDKLIKHIKRRNKKLVHKDRQKFE